MFRFVGSTILGTQPHIELPLADSKPSGRWTILVGGVHGICAPHLVLLLQVLGLGDFLRD